MSKRLTEGGKQKNNCKAPAKQPTILRPKSEEEIWKETKEAAQGNYLSEKAWKRVRSRLTNKTGWSTARYDAWMANKVQEGKLKTGKKNPAVGTQQRREAATGQLTAQLMRVSRPRKSWLGSARSNLTFGTRQDKRDITL